MQKYWDKIYSKKETKTLGWYEESPDQSLRLIEKCNLKKEDRILITGAGSTTLVDNLLDMGYKNIIATDISSKALEVLKQRLGTKKSNSVEWIIDDLTNPINLIKIGKADLWFDRAVLHFFTEEIQRFTYFNLLKNLISSNGYVILAQFNPDSATMCSGLPVYQYDIDLLGANLGDNFKLLESFNHTYTMPSGDTREYIYGMFVKV